MSSRMRSGQGSRDVSGVPMMMFVIWGLVLGFCEGFSKVWFLKGGNEMVPSCFV